MNNPKCKKNDLIYNKCVKSVINKDSNLYKYCPNDKTNKKKDLEKIFIKH